MSSSMPSSTTSLKSTRLATSSLTIAVKSFAGHMDTHQISKILKNDRFTKHHFRGVFACDQLPKQYVPRLRTLVINTDPSTKPGQHWVAIYITRDGEGEYFDSYGQPVKLPQVKKFLKKNVTRQRYNRQPLQGPLSAVCGQYSIFFLLQRCRGLSMTNITSLFSYDWRDNDILINDFIRTHFPHIKTTVYDEQFLEKQIARALFNTSRKM